jgi:membrane fusion protein (multidrug efflux system)
MQVEETTQKAPQSPHPPQAKTNGELHTVDDAQAPAKKRRPWAILGGLAVVVAAGIGAFVVLTAGKEDTDDAQVTADVVPVAARASGAVIKVAIVENQAVKKGDLLAQIDDADYLAKVDQAQAEVESQTAQAQSADAMVRVTEARSKGGLRSAKAAFSGSAVGVQNATAQIAAARAALVKAESEVHRTETDLGRMRELRAANAVTQERFDNAQSASDSAVAGRAQAQAQLAAAEEQRNAAQANVSQAEGNLAQSSSVDSQIASSRAQADLAHARVKSAQAQLALAKLQLSYTRIVAPTDGFASKLSVHEGQLAQIGQPIVQLVPAQSYVIANFKETQVGKMKPGQRAEIEIDAFPGKKFEGKVESLAGGTGASFALLPADNASGNFVKVVQRVPVRVSWVNAPAEVAMRAGLSVEVTVWVDR